MSLRAGVRRTSYRGGAADQRETTASVGGEVEYLMNRHISIFVNANYAQRYARIDLDDFKRTGAGVGLRLRSEEHTSELQSLMRISYAVFCLKKKTSPLQLQSTGPRKRHSTKHILNTHMM